MGTITRTADEAVSTSDNWSRLPDDVVSRVLSRLTVAQLYRARTVCKQWNALTSTPEFRSLFNVQSEPYYPVVIARRFYMGDLGICILGKDEQGGNDLFRVFCGYDHETGTWQKLPPLDFLPREAKVPVASAGGILCFRGTSSLFLCNPVARTCVELPAITYKWPASVSVHIVVAGDSYKVIIVGKIRHNFVSDSFRSIAIYESTTKAWRVVDAQHPSKVFSYGPTAAVCGRFVYCEAICNCGQLGVMAYDIEAEAWQRVLYEIPPDDRGDYQLTQVVECGGSIYTVIARGFGGVPTGVYILKLEHPQAENPSESKAQHHPTSNAWKEVTILGDELMEDLRNQWYGDDDADIVCVAHGTRICISAGVNLVLVYHVQTGLWSKVPTCSSQLFELGVNFSAEPIHFPIQLRLTTAV